MINYSFHHIAKIINGSIVQQGRQQDRALVIDSRKIIFPASSIFFALTGPRRDGHYFIEEVYEKGIRNFVISKSIRSLPMERRKFCIGKQCAVKPCRNLLASSKSHFSYPVIGITGSNGKTIVKEWLNQLLEPEFNIVRSPKSYNSQIGVPLSVWQMSDQHDLAIFEAGISLPGEMENLEKIIQPTIGIFTNIGEAHSEGFQQRET